jgi:3,4-dihydroxy 2-butanone 4-phosphate synthase/GTP cyclohydrolase II
MPSRITKEVATAVPTKYGVATFVGYWDSFLEVEHLFIKFPNPIEPDASQSTLIRVHSECITGEALGSQKCECGPQLDAALRIVSAQGGAVLYLRGHEGRGIGLINKLKAYRLQEDGLDTVDANLHLGLPAEARDFTPAALMLQDQGMRRVKLLSNNPEKISQLKSAGIMIDKCLPLIVGVNNDNIDYLRVKTNRMGHQIDETSLSDSSE